MYSEFVCIARIWLKLVWLHKMAKRKKPHLHFFLLGVDEKKVIIKDRRLRREYRTLCKIFGAKTIIMCCIVKLYHLLWIFFEIKRR